MSRNHAYIISYLILQRRDPSFFSCFQQKPDCKTITIMANPERTGSEPIWRYYRLQHIEAKGTTKYDVNHRLGRKSSSCAAIDLLGGSQSQRTIVQHGVKKDIPKGCITPASIEEKRQRKKASANDRRARRRKRSRPAGREKSWCRKTLGFVVCVYSMQYTEMNCSVQWCELQSSTNYGANPNVTQPYERVTFAKGHVAGTRARDANSGLVKFKTWWGTLDRNGPRFASLAPPLGCDDTIVATGTASATLSLSHHMPLRSFCISSGMALLLPVSHPSKPSKRTRANLFHCGGWAAKLRHILAPFPTLADRR